MSDEKNAAPAGAGAGDDPAGASAPRKGKARPPRPIDALLARVEGAEVQAARATQAAAVGLLLALVAVTLALLLYLRLRAG